MAEIQVFRPAALPDQPTIAIPLLDDIRGSVSANTLRAYRADVRAWSEWADRNAIQSFPADPAAVADHLRGLAGTLKASSLTRRVAAIAWAHKAAGQPFDAKAPVIAFAMERIRREHGAAVEGKAPLKTDDIKAILRSLPVDSIAGLRDRALILLGFASALRRSEIAALDLSDAEFGREGATLTVRRSKGDQHGKGQVAGIRYGRKETTCPVRALQAWIRAAQIGSGPLFRQLRGSVVSADRLSDDGIFRVVKRACAAAGLDPARYGAHSLRSGHVTEALGNGADPRLAQVQLRHRSIDTTLGYDRRRSSLKDSTSGKLGL